MSTPHFTPGQQPGPYPPPHAFTPPSAPRAPGTRLAIAAAITGATAFVLGWIPGLGVILGLTALVLGIVALVKKQHVAWSTTGIVGGALGTIASVVVIGFLVSVAMTPTQNPPVALPSASPVASATSEPAPSATPTQTPTPSATPSSTPDEPVTDIAAIPSIDARAFDLVVRDPDAHIGEQMIVYGIVTQFDAATGQCTFRASLGATTTEHSWDYEHNSVLGAGDTASDCPLLDNIVADDHVKIWVTVLGSYSYDTQIGGNTTVPAFFVEQIELLPAQTY